MLDLYSERNEECIDFTILYFCIIIINFMSVPKNSNRKNDHSMYCG